MKPPLHGQLGSLFIWVGIFHVKEVDASSSLFLTRRGTYPLHPHVWSCKPWPSSVSGHIDLEVHHPMASTGSDVIPPAKHVCSFQHLQPHPITWGLHPSSVDAPAHVHGRSHNLPLIHPREVLLAGHWVIALPILSCGIILLSPPVEVGLCGVGADTPVPCMTDA